MTEDITKVEYPSHESVSEADTGMDAGLPVIMELRAVAVSPAGTLFDQYPIDHGRPKQAGFIRRHFLFILLFVLPTTISTVYFGMIAADRYVTEAKFIVRSASGGDSVALSALMSTPGLSRAVDEAYAVDEYITSRDIIPTLDRDHALHKIFSRREADFISRFPNPLARDDFESLYKHFKRVVTIEPDATTGISTLSVETYRPEDSLVLAENILAQAELFINQLNVRANDDALEFAESVRDEAAAKLKDVNQRLTEYRNRELIIDPSREAAAAMEMLGKVSGELILQETKLSEMKSLTPNSPALIAQREKVAALTRQYSKMREIIVGSDSSLVNKLSGYENLALEQELAQRNLATAAVGIEKARQDAKSRRIYLQSVVSPRMSDFPTRPLRLMWIGLTAGFSLCIYGIARTFRDTVLEHQA